VPFRKASASGSFWPEDPPGGLVGIARLAAESPLIEAKRRVEYLEIGTRSLVGKCLSPRMPFVWTINPYRGCEFGCGYCYARYTHEFMELRDPALFETRIFAKHFDADTFRARLCRQHTRVCIPAKRSRRWPVAFHRGYYRRRHKVENFFCRIKRYRRLSTRYEKLAITFLAFVQLAAVVDWLIH